MIYYALLRLFSCSNQEAYSSAADVDLVPGGSTKPVTEANKAEYTRALARNRLGSQSQINIKNG